jgi:hypothetical protein
LLLSKTSRRAIKSITFGLMQAGFRNRFHSLAEAAAGQPVFRGLRKMKFFY